MSKRWVAFLLAGGSALLALVMITVVLSQEMVPAPTPTADAGLAVAVVNGEAILQEVWAEAVRVDRVMSGLAGLPSADPEEKLEELVNRALVLQEEPQEPPTDAEVAQSIVELEQRWAVDDEQVVSALAAADLTRAALERAMREILMAQRAQEAVVEATGIPIEDWLIVRRGQAEIVIYRERMGIVFPTPFPLPSPSASLPAVPQSSLGRAPDFALGAAGGTVFTLSEQLSLGPVALVFFQRCG